MHNRTPNRWSPLIAAALVADLGTGLAVAQDHDPLQPRQVGEITLINAGASVEEVDVLKRLSPQYPLRVVMSNPNGEYVVASRTQKLAMQQSFPQGR